MTHQELDTILEYFVENFISPLCFDKRPAKEIWLEQSGEKFRALYQFMLNMQKESDVTFDIRRASELDSVCDSVTVSSISELMTLSEEFGHDLIITSCFNEDDSEANANNPAIIVYDDYLE